MSAQGYPLVILKTACERRFISVSLGKGIFHILIVCGTVSGFVGVVIDTLMSSPLTAGVSPHDGIPPSADGFAPQELNIEAAVTKLIAVPRIF